MNASISLQRVAVMLATTLLCISASSHAASTIFDEWWTPGYNARIRIEPCGAQLCGRIVWVWDEAPQDITDSRPLGRPANHRRHACGRNGALGGRAHLRPGRWPSL